MSLPSNGSTLGAGIASGNITSHTGELQQTLFRCHDIINSIDQHMDKLLGKGFGDTGQAAQAMPEGTIHGNIASAKALADRLMDIESRLKLI